MEAGSLRYRLRDPMLPLLEAGLILLCGVIGLVAGVAPGLAIGGALAVAFALAALANLAVGVALWAPFAFLYPGVLGKPLVAALGVLALSWLAGAVRGERVRDPASAIGRQRVAGLMALLLGWVALSLAWAPSSSAALLDLSRFLLSGLLFAVTYSAVKDRSTATLVIVGFLVGAAAAAAYSLIVPPDPGSGRLTGAGSRDPNELAASMLPAIALAGGAIAGLRGFPIARLLLAGVGILCLASFLGTASRGGLIGLAAMLVVAIFAGGRWRPAVILLAVGAVSLVVVYFGSFASTSVQDRITQADQGQVRVEESRLTLWDVAWRMFEDHPIAGVGVGNFADQSVPYLFVPGQLFRSDVVINQHQPAHNSYLHLLAELGLVGGLLFAALITFCCWAALAAARMFAAVGDRLMEAFARSLFVGLVGLATAIFFFSAQTVNELWYLLALGPGLLAVARAAASSQGTRGSVSG